MSDNCEFCAYDGVRVTAARTVDVEGEARRLCGACARDYTAWVREQDAAPVVGWEGYDGPSYADTMSGGTYVAG
jgi:transcriptional regulator NrdR family protein